MHRSYEWIIWLNQVDFFVMSRMGWNLKKQTNKKNSPKNQTKTPTKQATLDKYENL